MAISCSSFLVDGIGCRAIQASRLTAEGHAASRVCSDSSLATIQFAQPEPTIQESEFFDPEIEALYQKELQREAEEQAQWEAEERAKEAARLAAAKRKRETALFKRARLWKRCGDLREFVEAVRTVVEGRPLPEGARQEAAEWIEWATGVADAYDPLATWAEQLPDRARKPR